MLDSTQLVKDVGTMLEGEEAVREGLIDEVGGISQAFEKLHELIDIRREERESNPSVRWIAPERGNRAGRVCEKINNDTVFK